MILTYFTNNITSHDSTDINILLKRSLVTLATDKSSNLNNTQVERFPVLHIGCHNINGLASTENAGKFFNILRFMNSRNIDIFVITETNIGEKEGRFLVAQFNNEQHSESDQLVVHWLDKKEDKRKGSGVAVIVNQKWARHFFKCYHRCIFDASNF